MAWHQDRGFCQNARHSAKDALLRLFFCFGKRQCKPTQSLRGHFPQDFPGEGRSPHPCVLAQRLPEHLRAGVGGRRAVFCPLQGSGQVGRPASEARPRVSAQPPLREQIKRGRVEGKQEKTEHLIRWWQ